MAHAWITVPFSYWSHMRQLAAELGMRLDESKGIIRRTFTFHGTDAQVRSAYAEFERLKAAQAEALRE